MLKAIEDLGRNGTKTVQQNYLSKVILLAVFTLLIHPINVFPESQDDYMEEIVITATRWEEPLGQVPDRMTVIKKDEIAGLPARDAAEALELVPGVIMDRTGGPGSIVFPSVQGSEFYQTAIFINGIPFNDLANGIGNLGQIPADQIDRIEIVHGAGGTEWGSALGGVINVITHRPDRNRTSSVTVAGGDYATGFASVDLQLSSKNIAAAIGGGIRNGVGPEIKKRANNSKNFTGNMEVDIAENSLLTFLGYTFQGEAGSGAFRSALRGYWENYKYRTSGGGVTLFSALGFGEIKLTGYYQNQTQNTQQNSDATGQLDDVRLEDRIIGGSAIWRGVSGTAALTLGAEGKDGNLQSTGLMADSYQISTSGAFVNLQKKISRLILQGGLRQSREGYFGSFTGYNIGAVYRTKNIPVEFRFLISHGYTAPPLAFRFLEITDYFAPNPDLKLEKVTAYQAGLKSFPIHGLTIDLNGFQADVTDAISISSNELGLSVYKNFDQFQKRGIEAEIDWKTGYGISLLLNTLQQEILNVKANEVVKNKVKASYSTSLGYGTGRFSSQLIGTWRDWNTAGKYVAEDKKWLWSGKATFKQKIGNYPLTASISFYNITNVVLATNSLLPPIPPRQIEIAVEFKY